MMQQAREAWSRCGRFARVGALLLVLVTGLAVWAQVEEPAEPTNAPSPRAARTEDPFDWPALRRTWHARIEAVEMSGGLPILDIESSLADSARVTAEFDRVMDECGVALIAFGAEMRKTDLPGLVRAHPDRIIPVPHANLHRHLATHDDANPFLDRLFADVLRNAYPTMGEYFFRHYPSNRQQSEDAWPMTDVHIPIDGPYANRIFAFSQQTGIPFQIHYEVEDGLLPPLEKMLSRYPGARVVWCHVGRVRFGQRGQHYGAEYVRGLLARCPNLYFDTSCSDPMSVWPLRNGDRVSRMWDEGRRHLQAAWVDVVVSYPDRFLAALDLGSDRLDVQHLRNSAFSLRRFLDELPADVRKRIAYRNSWKLLFHEEF